LNFKEKFTQEKLKSRNLSKSFGLWKLKYNGKTFSKKVYNVKSSKKKPIDIMESNIKNSNKDDQQVVKTFSALDKKEEKPFIKIQTFQFFNQKFQQNFQLN
jgi:hypothetical protein